MALKTPDDWCATATPITSIPDGRSGLISVTPSALCSIGWRPLMVTGLMRDVLTRHFAVPIHIEEPDLRQLVWQEGERTGILIESIYRWRGSLVEKRPAVIIKPNGRKNARYGIADRLGPTEQGFERYMTFWVGSHTLFCIHGSGASVEILATEVQRELTQFAPVLVRYLNLMTFRVTEVGAIAELEEAKESWVIPITVAWAYPEIWQVEQESLKLRKVALSVLLDGALYQETT